MTDEETKRLILARRARFIAAALAGATFAAGCGGDDSSDPKGTGGSGAIDGGNTGGSSGSGGSAVGGSGGASGGSAGSAFGGQAGAQPCLTPALGGSAGVDDAGSD